MLKLLTLLLLLLASFLPNNKQPTLNKTRGWQTGEMNKKGKDTIFISREVTKNNYCAVYIDKKRNSTNYNDLLDFNKDSSENVWYKENYKMIKTHNPAPYRIFNLSGLPKKWVPLYKYKNKYYIYHPSEPGAMSRKIITDSTLNYWYMDGQYPEPIQSLEKLNGHTWRFGLNPFRSNDGFKKITIRIIDAKKEIAVWEDSSAPIRERYELYVSREKARNFDMIANFCRETKAAEFIFDEPDYEALIMGRKGIN